MLWRIYYEDGTTFSNADGQPWESPVWGVVAVTQQTKQQFDDILARGEPWYIYRSDLGYWMEIDNTGLIDQLVHYGHEIQAVRPGRYVPKPVFMAIVRRAQAEIDTWQVKAD